MLEWLRWYVLFLLGGLILDCVPLCIQLATKKVKPEEDDECLMITSEDHPAPQVKEEKEVNKSISGVELIEVCMAISF